MKIKKVSFIGKGVITLFIVLILMSGQEAFSQKNHNPSLVCPIDCIFFCAWGSANDDVFFGGSGGIIIHYDGKSWQRFFFGKNETFFDLVGFSHNNIYALSVTTCGKESRIYHYDGKKWKKIKTFKGTLFNIWGASPSNIYAIGKNVYIFDGKAWRKELAGGSRVFTYIDGSSKNDIYIAGYDNRNDFILHFDGSTWKRINKFPNSFTFINISVVSNSEVYCLGHEDGYSQVMKYDGKNTSEFFKSDKITLRRFWHIADNHIFLSGVQRLKMYSVLLFKKENIWYTVEGPFLINAIWGDSGNNVFLAGGAIYHYDGKKFRNIYGFEGIRNIKIQEYKIENERK